MPSPRSLIRLILVTLAYLATLPWLGSLDISGREMAVFGAVLTVVVGAISGSWWSAASLPAAVFLVFAVPAILFRPEVNYRDEGGVSFQVAMSVFVSLIVFVPSIVGCTAAELTRHFYSAVADRRHT